MKILKLILILGIFSFLSIKAAEENEPLSSLCNNTEDLYNSGDESDEELNQIASNAASSNISDVPASKLNELIKTTSQLLKQFEESLKNQPKSNFTPAELLEFALYYFINNKYVQASILLNEIINIDYPIESEDEAEIQKSEDNLMRVQSEAKLLQGRIYEIMSINSGDKPTRL